MPNHHEWYRTHVLVLWYTVLMSLFISVDITIMYDITIIQTAIPTTSPAVLGSTLLLRAGIDVPGKNPQSKQQGISQIRNSFL